MKTEVLNNDLATVRVNVEDVEEAVTEAVEIVRNNPVVLATVAVVAGAAGLAVGYFAAKNRLTVRFEQELVEQMAETRRYYARLHKHNEYETPEQAAEHLLTKEAVSALREYRGEAENVDDELTVVASDEPVEVTTNVFVRGGDFDYDAEVKNRTPDVPYVITQEEFMENDVEHEQTTLTYYEGDDTLADENGENIEDSDVDDMIGVGNLARFGQGSNDNNVVYVRNEDREMDYEVLRSRGKYSREVLGILEHSEPRAKSRRFRHED